MTTPPFPSRCLRLLITVVAGQETEGDSVIGWKTVAVEADADTTLEFVLISASLLPHGIIHGGCVIA